MAYTCERCGATFTSRVILSMHKCDGKRVQSAASAGRVELVAVQPVSVVPKPEEILEPKSERVSESEETHSNHIFTELPPLDVPPREPNFYIDRPVLEMLNRVYARTQNGQIINILIRGPKGSGKTTLAREFAAMHSRPFYILNCEALTEPEQLFGKDRLTKGETWYRMARFILAIETPNAVVALDEANRPHPQVMDSFFGLLDWRRSMWVDDLCREVRVAPGVVFFATVNEGVEYLVNPLDAALRERFGRAIELNIPPKHETSEIVHKRTGLDKAVCDRLADFAFKVNLNTKLEYFVSIRQLLVTAEELVDGASLREAITVAVANHVPDNMVKAGVYQALQDVGISISDIVAGESDANKSE